MIYQNEAALFKGLHLDEIVSHKYRKPNFTLILHVENDEIQEAYYRPRTDGAFDLKIIYPETTQKNTDVIDLICAVYTHPDTPDWLKDTIWETMQDNATIRGYNEDELRLYWKFRNKEGFRSRRAK